MGGGLESRCVSRVCGADGAVQKKIPGYATAPDDAFAQSLETDSEEL